jgi:peptidoglycan/xylan/chitin deacetylase (PgdA/CDA1 family)
VILIFTYHKICAAESARDPDFYTVSREAMVAQIKAALAAGYRALSFPELGNGPIAAGKHFLLTFDDGTVDHCETVLPQLKELGLPGIFFVPTAKLNRPGYLTDAQVRELAAAGQTIGFHSHEHRRMDVMTDDEMRQQFRLSRDILTRLTGSQPLHFAPPGGFLNEHLREVALGFGAQVIRTMRWGFNHDADLTGLETVPLNRHTTARKFQKILEGKQPRLVYLGKQTAKALVPARAYERLRERLFKLARKN